MKYLIGVFSLFSCLFFGQSTEIRILNVHNQPVDSVEVYLNSAKVGFTNKEGRFKVANVTAKDSIFLFNKHFLNFSGKVSELAQVITLDSIRTEDIAGVTLTKTDPADILKKAFAIAAQNDLYKKTGNIAVINELKVGNQILYSINNKFFFKPHVGYFAENRNGVLKNFESRKEQNSVLNVYQVENHKFSLPLLNHRLVTARYIPQFKELIENLDNYNFSVSKKDSLLIIDFSPVRNLEKTYIGRMIVNENDFGIVEAVFNLIKNPNNKFMTSAEANTRIQFHIEREKFVIKYEKIDGKYVLLFTTYDYSFKALNGKIKNKSFIMNYQLKSIDKLNVESSHQFDFQTLEFLK